MPSQVVIDRTKLFIKRYGQDIARAILNTDLYFEAVIGQKCLESAFGDSSLAKKSNNFGGIKNFGNLQGAIGTTSSGFAIFATPYDCFAAYVRTLQSPTKKYISKGVFTAASPEDQINRMVQAGYCAGITPAQYVSRCQGAIDSVRSICPLGKITDLSAGITQIQQSTT